MLKNHCDVCDKATGDVKAAAVVSVPVPGKPHWDWTRLKVTVIVSTVDYTRDDTEPLSGARKDLCDECRKKILADAFNLEERKPYAIAEADNG